MARTALREQDDAGSRAARLVDDSFVFDSVQVLRTGGPGRPRLLFGTDHIGEEYFDDWKAAGIKAFMRATIARPKLVSPPPEGSSIAVPSRFCPNVTRMQQRSPSSAK